MKTFVEIRFDITGFTEQERKNFVSAVLAQAEGARDGRDVEVGNGYPDAMITRTVLIEEEV